MARSTPERKALRSLVWLLVIIVALIGANGASVAFNNGEWTPKLALDLEGGTQMILEAQLESGAQPSQEQMDQAVGIIRQRVDAAGVERVGDQHPGRHEHRRVDPRHSRRGHPRAHPPLGAARVPRRSRRRSRLDRHAGRGGRRGRRSEREPEPRGERCRHRPGGRGERPGRDRPAASESPATEEPLPTPSVEPTDASDPNWITPELQERFDSFDCATVDEAGANIAPRDEPLITCENDTIKYILGPVEVTGEAIDDATAGLVPSSTGATTNEWGVFIDFDSEGTQQFREVTERLVTLQGVRNQFAIVLDGRVISAPQTISAITDGSPQISGSFDQESSQTLADQLQASAPCRSASSCSRARTSPRPSASPSCRAASSPVSSVCCSSCCTPSSSTALSAA